MKQNNYRILTTISLAILLTATTIISTVFDVPAAFATDNNKNGDNDKVKLKCSDGGVVFLLLGIELLMGTVDPDIDIDATLEESEIAADSEDFINALDKILDDVKDECDDEELEDIEFEFRSD